MQFWFVSWGQPLSGMMYKSKINKDLQIQFQFMNKSQVLSENMMASNKTPHSKVKPHKQHHPSKFIPKIDVTICLMKDRSNFRFCNGNLGSWWILRKTSVWQKIIMIEFGPHTKANHMLSLLITHETSRSYKSHALKETWSLS